METPCSERAAGPQVRGVNFPRRRAMVNSRQISKPRSVNSSLTSRSFQRQTLFAHEKRCAVTRTQLRLVEAAHILPVGAPGSADHVRNGIALSPTYHRAYDAGLIFLDESLNMRLNESRIPLLEGQGLTGGLENFRLPLGPIFLPPDPNQRPSAEFIRMANKIRQIPT